MITLYRLRTSEKLAKFVTRKGACLNNVSQKIKFEECFLPGSLKAVWFRELKGICYNTL